MSDDDRNRTTLTMREQYGNEYPLDCPVFPIDKDMTIDADMKAELNAAKYTFGDKWRVTVHMNGAPQFYNDYTLEALADRYADQMRDLYKRENVPGVFVRKVKVA